MRITTVVKPPIQPTHIRSSVFAMGLSLVFVALRTPASAQAADMLPTTQQDIVASPSVSAPTEVKAPPPVSPEAVSAEIQQLDTPDAVPAVGKPAADPPVAVSAVIPGEAAVPPAAQPATVPQVETQRAEVIPPPVPHGHVAAAESMSSAVTVAEVPVAPVLVKPVPMVSVPVTVTPVPVTPVPVTPVHVSPVPVPPAHVTPAHVTPAHVTPVAVPPAHVSHAADAPARVIDPPVINSVQNLGSRIHIAWKPLGAGVTYKVYAMPDVQKKNFEFRFYQYGTDLTWVLHENKAWRYVAVTAVNKNGDETPLSNIVDTKHPVALTPPPPPPVLAPPVIDTVENLGPYVHLAWKSLGSGVTYKVYAMPNTSRPDFQFRFNLYGTDLQWSLGDNTAWRYVAVTAVDKNGKESPLSNVVDTTPGLPKPGL